MKEIELTQGKVAIVDDKDFGWLNKWKWYAHGKGNLYYARRNENAVYKNKTIRMHRLILECHGHNLRGLGVDHVNHNGLDNRLNNLRPADQSQNNQNKSCARGLSSYKGVYLHSMGQKWRANIRKNGRRIHLGLFEKEEDAAKAYNQAALKLFGEFACLNNIKEI